MPAVRKPKPRRRSAAGLVRERAWLRRFRELVARMEASRPPMPDPNTQPHEFIAWMDAHKTNELPPELKALMAEARELPRLKYRRQRDAEVWSWIAWLRACQGWGADFDLRTCGLGANPANAAAKPSKTLQQLGYLVAHRFPEPFSGDEDQRRKSFVRLYDAIRNWRRSVSTTHG